MKTRIKILQPVMLGGKMIRAGKIVEISQKAAVELISRGVAAKIEDAPEKK